MLISMLLNLSWALIGSLSVHKPLQFLVVTTSQELLTTPQESKLKDY
jgi:hypothetical protein